MKTDRELLELAAKAAGVEYAVEASKPHPKSGAWFGLWLVIHGEPNEFTRRRWNPITDDGDALRLAVQMGMLFTYMSSRFEMFQRFYREELDNDLKPSEATRRAIVRAAAEIGNNT
jgi:hypothetical protein